jgi:hypothetical protein
MFADIISGKDFMQPIFISVVFDEPGYHTEGYELTRIPDWEVLGKLVTKYAWSNCLYAGQYRKEKFFSGSCFCVLDIDDGLTKKEAKERLGSLTYLLGPTKSDGIPKNGKPACDRFRVIIPWEEPIYRLDIYKYNMRKVISEFSGDSQTSDGGRVWQPCAKVETIKSSGTHLPVIYDIPLEDTNEYKQKRMSEIFDYRKKSKTLSARAKDFLQGHHIKGEMNNHLFSVACELFNHGHSLEDLRNIFGSIGVTKWHNYESTVRSAARHSGFLE